MRRKPEMFDPEKMRAIAEQMIKEGKMPSQEKFLRVMDEVRKEFAPLIIKARQEARSSSKRRAAAPPKPEKS